MGLMVAASTSSEFSKDAAVRLFNESFGDRRLLPAADFKKIDSDWNDFLSCFRKSICRALKLKFICEILENRKPGF
jgi:hypothetical protein